MAPNKKVRRSPRSSPPDRPTGTPAPPPPTAPRVRPALAAGLCAALFLVVLFAYRRSASSEFITLDDPLYVTANERVQEGLSAGSIAWAWTTFDATNWHPLTWLSHMLDVELFGLDAGKHHLTSVVLHGANAVLLLVLLFRMTGALWRSALVAALFALHPLHVESVAWIAERKDVLSTLFWLMTLLAWLAFVKSRKAVPYALVLLFYALGLMAKPMLVSLPFTLLLLDFWPLRRIAPPLWERAGTLRKLFWEKAPLFAMAAVSCVVTVVAQKSGGAVRSLTQIPLDERAANAGLAYVAYLFKTIWPASLSIFYPYAHSGALTAAAAAAVLSLAVVTLLAFALRHRAPYLLFGWLWYLGTLVPVIGLVQVGDQAMADRYTYVPLVGIFIAAAWGLAGLAGESRARRRAAAVAAAGMLAALFGVTCVQAGYWVNAETVFGHALKVTSDNWMAHNCLGLAIAFSDDGRMAEAIPHFTEALRLNPRHSDLYNNLAMALKATGRLEEAVEQYRKSLQLKPGAPIPLRNLVVTLLRLDRIPEALDCLREARLPQSGGARERTELGMPVLQAGLDLIGRKDYPRAVLLFEQAAALVSPMPPEGLTQWGHALLQLSRYEEAADRFRSVLALDPDNGEAHFELGYALSQSQRPAEAIAHYRAAYGKRGVRGGSLVWVGDIYRRNGLCEEAMQVYAILPPGDPAYPAAASGIAA